jgi:hypothetical protein
LPYLTANHRLPEAYAIWSFSMTWQNCRRTLAFALFGAIALILGPEARAEDGLISPDQAETLVHAQIEEQKAAAAAQKEEEEAIAAEEAKSAKTGKAADKKKPKEAVAAAKAPAPAKALAVKAEANTEEAARETRVEETASLPVALPASPRSDRADAVKARALKPLIVRYASENSLPYGPTNWPMRWFGSRAATIQGPATGRISV